MTLILNFITVCYNAIVTNSQTTKNVLYYIRSLQKVECKTEVRLCNMCLYKTLYWAFGITNIQVYYFSLRGLFRFPIIIHILEGHKIRCHTTIETKMTFFTPTRKYLAKKLYLPFFSNYKMKYAFTSELITEWSAYYIRCLILVLSIILYEISAKRIIFKIFPYYIPNISTFFITRNAFCI